MSKTSPTESSGEEDLPPVGFDLERLERIGASRDRVIRRKRREV